MNRILLLAMVALLVSPVLSGQQASPTFPPASQPVPGKILTPEAIGVFVSPEHNSEDDTYPFVPDPKGQYYHFETFVGEGDSPWDTFVKYEEKFTASSALKSSNTISYDAENLRNDKLRAEGGGIRSAAWCEGVAGYGIGERITMRVRTKAYLDGRDDEIRFTSVMIVNGYAKDATAWKNNSRVKSLRLHINNELWCDFHLNDDIQPQIFSLPAYLQVYPAKSGKQIPENGAFTNPLVDENNAFGAIPVYQTELVFEIREVFAGEKFDDTCLTGIALDVKGGIYE